MTRRRRSRQLLSIEMLEDRTTPSAYLLDTPVHSELRIDPATVHSDVVEVRVVDGVSDANAVGTEASVSSTDFSVCETANPADSATRDMSGAKAFVPADCGWMQGDDFYTEEARWEYLDDSPWCDSSWYEDCWYEDYWYEVCWYDCDVIVDDADSGGPSPGLPGSDSGGDHGGQAPSSDAGAGPGSGNLPPLSAVRVTASSFSADEVAASFSASKSADHQANTKSASELEHRTSLDGVLGADLSKAIPVLFAEAQSGSRLSMSSEGLRAATLDSIGPTEVQPSVTAASGGFRQEFRVEYERPSVEVAGASTRESEAEQRAFDEGWFHTCLRWSHGVLIGAVLAWAVMAGLRNRPIGPRAPYLRADASGSALLPRSGEEEG